MAKIKRPTTPKILFSWNSFRVVGYHETICIEYKRKDRLGNQAWFEVNLEHLYERALGTLCTAIRDDEIVFAEPAEPSGPQDSEVMIALRESVKLQSHYANLLNNYDNGQRLKFETANDWIARLKKTGTIE